MKVFILFLIFGTGRMDGGVTSIKQEYATLQQCQDAASLVVSEQHKRGGYIFVLTCSEGVK